MVGDKPRQRPRLAGQDLQEWSSSRLGETATLALSVIERPTALTLAAGHLLASTRSSKALRDFGEASDEAKRLVD